MSGFDKTSSWVTLTSSFIGVGGTKPGLGVGRGRGFNWKREARLEERISGRAVSLRWEVYPHF